MFNLLCVDSKVYEILTVVAFTIVAVILALITIFNKKFNKNKTKMMAYGAISLAMSFVLSFISIAKMPYGGSITIGSFVPLIIFAFIFGSIPGISVGIMFGILQFLISPWFINIAQFLFDYIIAFGSISMMGIVGTFVKGYRKPLILGTLATGLCRLISHVAAGIIFYSEYFAPQLPFFGSTDGMTSFVYSLTYNAAYVIPDILISLIIIVLLSTSSVLKKSIMGLKNANMCNM